MSTADAPPPEDLDAVETPPEAEPVEPDTDVPEVDEGAEDEVELVSSREQELEDQLQALQARLRAVSAAYREQQEEIAQTKARLQRQAALKEEMRRGEVVAGLFDPVQNLKRSLDALKKGATLEDTAKGLELVMHQFMASFEKLGLEEVPGQGARFDPNLHEALTLVPVADAALDDVVLEVFSAGYRIGGRLITPARVVVGQYQEPVTEAEA
jgi:molecular chaperone GrpE